ncbi:MAG: beta-lactamase family protein [Thermoplasmatales archaeon]|nr:MAG: beta-lactamase family protein [Thermoplasmatales archaeon]
MEKNIFKKCLVPFIVLLLVGSNFISVSANHDSENKVKLNLTDEHRNEIKNIFFDLKISLFMKLARFPSISACIINDNQVIWSKGYGYYDLKNKKEATSDTIYIIASITKTIVGTALMQLWEQELFDLDEDVNNYLPFSLRNPNFPDEPITFRMLLSHTSSLNVNKRNEYYWINNSEDPPFDFFPMPYLEEFLIPGGKYYHEDIWSNTHKPGERARYANVGFDIISYLVEIISGEPFLLYCQHQIFDPLEMYNTSFNLSTLNIDNVALPYYTYLGKYYQINELTFIYGDDTPPYPYWKMRAYPAGGLYTSIDDLSHFLIAHMNDGIYEDTRILEKETVDLMHTIQPNNELGYGFAWMEYPISEKYSATGHGGDIVGVDTWMLFIPSEEIGVIYFANGNPAYGLLTSDIGFIIVQFLLYSLFRKGGLPSRSFLKTIYNPRSSFLNIDTIE